MTKQEYQIVVGETGNELVSKITGNVTSRHWSESAALARLRKADSGRDPLRIMPYSRTYDKAMGAK